ncbi:MAG: hypothetical protein QXP39_00795 [Candidatus Aenigmatarchaeota archaeon]
MVSLFGWGWKIRRLRRRWDRLREKALKKSEPARAEILQKLDVIENKIRTLEEQQPGIVLRARLAKEVEIDLAEIDALLKEK